MSELVPLASDGTTAPAPARPLSSPGKSFTSGQFGAVLTRLRTLAEQPAVARSMPALGLVGVAAAAALAWVVIAAPPQRSLLTGLPDSEKAAVVEALKSSGIAYDLDRATGAISVSESDYHQAKILLAQQGLPKSAPDGEAVINALPMGASRAVEDQRLRSAREMDLARTIEAIDAVQSARVHLAVEQPSVFVRDRSAPAASVMLQLIRGRRLSEAQVRAITHLVGSSVPGLSPDNVSVVDQDGRLLTRQNDPSAATSDRQLDIQRRIEQRYIEAVTTLLTPLIGAGNFSTEVHADVDFAEVQATRESFPQNAAAVRAETGSWTKDGGPEGASGIPGALANQPPPAAQIAVAPGGQIASPVPGAGAPPPAPPADRTTENYNRTFELGREISVTKQPVGSVRRLSIAVALRNADGKARTPAEVAAIENLVKGAVGFDQTRGDQIAITARNFVDTTPVEPAWWESEWLSVAARNLTALIVAVLVVFGIGRPLMKRRAALAAERAVQQQAAKAKLKGEIATAFATHVAADPTQEITLDMIEAAPGYAARAELIRSFVRQDPARAALVVRDLIRTDGGSGEVRNA